MFHRRAFLKLITASIVGTSADRSLFAAAPAIKYLKPGEFIWRPEFSPYGSVVAIVSLPEQLMHVYRNGIEIGVSTCSTGMKGHRTPTGVFTILQKHEEHYSNLYNNAPMPYMQRLTWSGVAIHAGNLPGFPASHGCVRIPHAFSQKLFTVTEVGSAVIIADKVSAPSEVLQPGLFLPQGASADAMSAADKAKRQNRSADVKSVPTSILVSAADRKGYLFRNGQLEYNTDITIQDATRPLGDHLYTFQGFTEDGGETRWLAFGLVSQKGEPKLLARSFDDTLSRIEVTDRPKAMEIAATLGIGTTMVVTDFAASPETRTAPDFVVLAAEKPRTVDPKPKPKAVGGKAVSETGVDPWNAQIVHHSGK